MFSVLLAEDEILTRVGIKSLINWQENGFELIGEAENGEEALKIAKEHSPDIIITDIKMPLINGIELIKAIKKLELKAEFIVISAYDDFEYVKTALKLGAVDYILKSEINSDNLRCILNELQKKLIRKTPKQDSDRYRGDRNIKNLELVKKQFLTDMIHGIIRNKNEVQQKLRELEINIDTDNYVCFVIHLNKEDVAAKYQDENLNKLNISIIDILNDILSSCQERYVFCTRKFEFTIILSRNELDRKGLHKTAINMVELLKDYCNVNSNIGISDLKQDVLDIQQAYEQACQAVEHVDMNLTGENILFYNMLSTNKSIHMAIQFIEENYNADISLQDVAGNIDISGNYLSNLFKQETGCNFVEFLTKLRIEKAKRMLRSSNEKIYIVAENVGYNNEFYFSKVFKKVVGISPNQYRKQKKRK